MYSTMRRIDYTLLVFMGIVAIFLFNPAPARARYDYIDITSPFLKKIPLAVPLFQNVNGDPEAEGLSADMSRLMSQALDFSGYFKLIDHAAFLEFPNKTGVVQSKLNFKNWTAIGAELLITGGIELKNKRVTAEFRLFDTFKGRLLVGRRYIGGEDEQRSMVHRFCNEVIFSLTGRYGIFDSQIAFVSTGTGKKEIYSCDFDGYHPRQITHRNSICLSPAWSSDGKWLAYTSYAKGKPDLYIRNLSENRGSVVAKPGINITPAWVPGKFALAATLSFSGDPEIYLLTGTGKIIKRLTNNWDIDVSPTFSPDGKKMAFVSKRSGTPQIYIQDMQTGQVDRLTFQGSYNTTPSWSPRGDKIAYSSAVDGLFNIFVIGVDKGEPMALTENAGDNEAPTWSPDGSLIAFSSNREGVNRIYVMTAFGTDQRRLLAMPGEQTNPKWSPRITNN